MALARGFPRRFLVLWSGVLGFTASATLEAPRLPPQGTDSSVQLVSDAQPQGPWMCHNYEPSQLAPGWCETAGVQGGVEYKFSEGGLSGPCSPCWCCKRNVAMQDASAGAGEAPDVNETKVSASETQKYEHTTVRTTGIVGETIVAGAYGTVVGDALTMPHNSGVSLFSKYEDSWEPENILGLKLLGKALSYTVDLSRVGCGCNLALYLIGAPARSADGQFSPGTNREGQPPYYCDANQVGGQWCPEVDIMEANNKAFQATAHKCDEPKNGHYTSCDRGGVEQNTRTRKGAYGPSDEYTIDTSKAFEVRAEFPEEAGVLIGMTTVLRQGANQVILDHDGDREYLAALSDVVAGGMSMRITYWGDKAETMSWMDSPPCGKEACTGSNAGSAVIRNMSVSSLATTQAPKKQTEEWLFTEPRDELGGPVLPKELLEDKEHSTFLRGPRSAARKVEEPCDGDATNPCETSLASEAGFMSMLAKKYSSLDAIAGHAVTGWSGLPMLAGCLLFVVLAAFVALGVRRLQHPGAGRQSAMDKHLDTNGAAAGASISGAGTLAETAGGLSRSGGLKRNGSSCQRLLGLV